MLITNGTLVTLGQNNQLIRDGALFLEGDRISALGPTDELRREHPDAEVIDARGRLVMPGLICAHTHFYGAFARGMALKGEAPSNFPQILEYLWWRLDKALNLEDIRYSALVCLVDAIRNGTTTLLDHHASPNAVAGSLDVIAGAVDEAGLRACLCYEVSDRDGPEIAQQGLRENERFIKEASGERLAGTFGLHASLTLSEETLAQAVETASKLEVGFHVHAAEDKADVNDSLKKYGLRVVERLEKAGILGPKTIAAHCVHIDAFEMDILRQTRTNVVHNPRSNMNNAVGVADVPGLLRRGVNVGLGNDGFSNNMFTEMETTYLLHKLGQKDPRAMGADQVLQMAAANNARIAGLFFTRPVGELAEGAYADIILVDYVPTTPMDAGNFPWHLVFGMNGGQVSTTIVGGKVLMKDRQLLTLDEEAICARSRELAQKVWARI
ncbi:MAG TPA: putative aminohydrolase SsnA [Anaerolineae bacterium]|nr:putative aminohydrolase SsnA [Anaerolineae bacterium]